MSPGSAVYSLYDLGLVDTWKLGSLSSSPGSDTIAACNPILFLSGCTRQGSILQMVSRLQSKSLYDLRPKIGSFVYSRESIDLVSVRGREGRESQTAGRIYRSQGQLERPRASLIKWKTPTPSSESFTEEPQAPEGCRRQPFTAAL